MNQCIPDDHYLRFVFAQELNNNAALCFEKGLYERATMSLHDGLKLLIAMNHSGHQFQNCGDCCSQDAEPEWDPLCEHPCTLDGCIAFSEQTSFLFNFTNEAPEGNSKRSHDASCSTPNKGPKKRRLSHSKDVSTGHTTSTEKPSNGFVYQRPIRVPLEGFCHCQKGYTSLLVVIVFNLAIAHHMNAMDGLCDAKAENIVFLYRLCLDLLHQASSLPNSESGTTTMSSAKSSTRCQMIIHNNLSQLHKLNGNKVGHEKCLQSLLSSLMVLTERNTRESTDASGYWDANRWGGPQNGEQSELVEGILDNLDPVIRNSQCADAA